jgi:hypothetical protein
MFRGGKDMILFPVRLEVLQFHCLFAAFECALDIVFGNNCHQCKINSGLPDVKEEDRLLFTWSGTVRPK